MIETIFLFFILIGLVVNISKRPKNFPNGPVGLPVIGFYHKIDEQNSENTWQMLSKRYGTMVGFYMGHFTIVLVSGWTAVKEALSNEDCNGRPDVCLLRDRFEGENYGVAFTDGENWKTQRRFTLHHFRNLGFGRKNHERVVVEEGLELVKQLKAYQGKPVDMETIVTSSLVNILWTLFGGRRYPHSDPLLTNIADNIQETMKHIKPYGSVACVLPFVRYLLPNFTGYNSIRKASTAMQTFLMRTIDEHKLSRVEGSPRDFIDVYLEELSKPEADRHPSFCIKQLEGICMDLLCAGVDTSSAAVRFALLFLCQRPDIQDKVREEIYTYIGTDRPPCMDDKANMAWTQSVIYEVLRLRTPAPTVIPHRVTKDTEILGYNIPTDTLLFINLRSIFMDEEYWQDATKFLPERHIAEDGTLKQDERLIYFGRGKRTCLGETVGRMSTILLLASLVQNFTFSFPEEDPLPDDEGVLGFTLNPPNYRIVATPIDHSSPRL